MSILFEKYGNKVWFVLLGACIIAAAVASANVFLVGHEQTFNTSRGVPWGILISTYVFLAISCSGLCMISSLGHVFGFHEFDMISRRAILLAILCLFGAFASIGMELEHPFKMFYTVLSPICNRQSGGWEPSTASTSVFLLLSFMR